MRKLCFKFVGVTCLAIFMLSVLCTTIFAYQTTEEIGKPTIYKMKVLVAVYNPVLKTKGNIKAFDYEAKTYKYPTLISNIEKTKKQFQDAAYGNVQIEYKIVELNKFPRTTQMLPGTNSYGYTEASWLKIMDGTKYDFWNSDYFRSIEKLGFIFDYEALVRDFDLVNKRNRGEFDQVWLAAPPTNGTFESMMIGRTAYWINGTPLIKSCKNFAVINLGIDRTDTTLENFGHMSENIMGSVFSYKDGSKTKTGTGGYAGPCQNPEQFNYDLLSTWDKFTLTDYYMKGYGAIGSMHFAPNATGNYDVFNTRYVDSNWRDWMSNYPNMKGIKEKVNNLTWYNPAVGTSFLDDPRRQYHYWWFSMFPHVAGRDANGYSNNWWEYWVTLDYAEDVKVLTKTKNIMLEGEVQSIFVSSKGKSGEIRDVSKIAIVNNITPDIIKVENGKITALKAGKAQIKCYLDGKNSLIYGIEVKKKY